MADSKKSQKMDIDLEAFKAQIDQTIDNLFMPSDGFIGEATIDGVEIEAAPPEPAPPDSPAAEPRGDLPGAPGLDLKDFEDQIDEKIDSLFAPMMESDASEEPSLPLREAKPVAAFESTMSGRSRTGDAPPHAGNEQRADALDIKAFEDEIDKEIDALFVPAAADISMDEETPSAPPAAAATAGPEPPPAVTPPQAPPLPEAGVEPAPPSTPDAELANLLEAMSIAYLSLDWEFSVENVSKLEQALTALEPYCTKLHETEVLLRMFRAVIAPLRTNPETVDRRQIELMRDVQALLKLLLLADGKVGVYEKEHLKNMVKRFQGTHKKSESPQPQPPEPPQPEASVAEVAALSDWRPLRELTQWMDACATRTNQALQKIEQERKRIKQLEETLSKVPALHAVASRLARARSGLGEQATHLGAIEQEWGKRAEWLKAFLSHLESVATSPPGVEPVPAPVAPAIPEPVVAPAEPEVVREEPHARPRPVETAEDELVRKRKETVYFFDVASRPMAAPAANVVKIDRASGKKLKKMIQRGYATILDFKPMLRNMKWGLLGNWKDLPADTLKGYKFIPASRDASAIPEEAGVVLISDGKRHAMILADNPAVEMGAEAEVVMDPKAAPGFCGSIWTSVGAPAKLIDVDHLLSHLG